MFEDRKILCHLYIKSNNFMRDFDIKGTSVNERLALGTYFNLYFKIFKAFFIKSKLG